MKVSPGAPIMEDSVAPLQHYAGGDSDSVYEPIEAFGAVTTLLRDGQIAGNAAFAEENLDIEHG